MRATFKNCEIISETAVLYSTWGGKLTVMKGKVFRSKNDYGIFVDEGERKTITCHLDQGKIYNAMVWLSERNDNFAKDMLIKYHEHKIEDMKEKINAHLIQILLIRGGL